MEWCKIKGCLGFVDTNGRWQKHNSIAHEKEEKRIKRRKYYISKAKNQKFALKLILMYALNIHQDTLLKDIEGKDSVTNKKLLQIIKLLEDKK